MRDKDILYLALGAGALYIGYNYLKSQEGKAPIETNISPNINLPNIVFPNLPNIVFPNLPNITFPDFNFPSFPTPETGNVVGKILGEGLSFQNKVDDVITQVAKVVKGESGIVGSAVGTAIGTAMYYGVNLPSGSPIQTPPSQSYQEKLGTAVNNVVVQQPVISEPQVGIRVPEVTKVLSGGGTVSIPTSSITGGSGNIVQVGGNQWGGSGTLYQKAGNFGVIRG